MSVKVIRGLLIKIARCLEKNTLFLGEYKRAKPRLSWQKVACLLRISNNEKKYFAYVLLGFAYYCCTGTGKEGLSNEKNNKLINGCFAASFNAGRLRQGKQVY